MTTNQASKSLVTKPIPASVAGINWKFEPAGDDTVDDEWTLEGTEISIQGAERDLFLIHRWDPAEEASELIDSYKTLAAAKVAAELLGAK